MASDKRQNICNNYVISSDQKNLMLYCPLVIVGSYYALIRSFAIKTAWQGLNEVSLTLDAKVSPPSLQTTTMATRWGICSAAKISHDFTVAMKTLPPADHQVQPRQTTVHLLN